MTAVIMAATPVSIPGKVCHQFRPDDGFSGMRRQLYFCHGKPRDVMKRMGKAQMQPSSAKNYITPDGLQRLRDERRFLLMRERPAVTEVVAWAASNGDRSENADYQYGKRRLREIDRRIRFLTKRIDAAEVVDPTAPRAGKAATQVFFGATVRYATGAGTERTVTIVGADEVDLERNYISWLSPLGRALMKAGPGDGVILRAPGGTDRLQILDVRYQRVPIEPFTEPAR